MCFFLLRLDLLAIYLGECQAWYRVSTGDPGTGDIPEGQVFDGMWMSPMLLYPPQLSHLEFCLVVLSTEDQLSALTVL